MAAPLHTDRPTGEKAGTGTPVEGADSIESWGWNRRQRIGLATLLLILLVVLAIQYGRNPMRLNEEPVVIDGQPITLPTRVDPNAATVEDLSRIPHLGEKLASKIVEWRDARKGSAADGIVFRRPEDLDAVPGIGPKLVAELKPYLRFPDDVSGTRPEE